MRYCVCNNLKNCNNATAGAAAPLRQRPAMRSGWPRRAGAAHAKRGRRPIPCLEMLRSNLRSFSNLYGAKILSILADFMMF